MLQDLPILRRVLYALESDLLFLLNGGVDGIQLVVNGLIFPSLVLCSALKRKVIYA